jgi:putative DNA primase/helicase
MGLADDAEAWEREGGITDHWKRVRERIEERYPREPDNTHPIPVQRYRTVVSEDDARVQFRNFLREEMHLDVRGELNADGRWHNVPVLGDRRFERSGGYQLHLDGVITGAARNWKESLTHDGWHPTGERVAITREEGMEMAALAEARRLQRAVDRLAENAAAVVKARSLIAISDPAYRDHPYLSRKHLDGEGFLQISVPAQMNGRNIQGHLIVPLYIASKLSGLQAIGEDGSKMYQQGAPVRSSYTYWGDPLKEGPIMIAEGAATAAAIHAATRQATYMAGNSANLFHIANHVRSRFPDRHIIVAGDNDQWHLRPGAWEQLGRPERSEIRGDDPRWVEWRQAGLLDNPGAVKAVEAAQAIKATSVLPNFPSNHPGKSTDFSDVLVENGPAAVRQQLNVLELRQEPPAQTRRNGLRM